MRARKTLESQKSSHFGKWHDTVPTVSPLLHRGIPSRRNLSINMPESLEEPVQEDLSFPLLVPLDVRPDPRDKPRQPLRSLGFHR